jgi:opacity protein-like surface antigen
VEDNRSAITPEPFREDKAMRERLTATIACLVVLSGAAGALTVYRVDSMERMEHPETGEVGVFSTYAPYIIRDDDYGLGLQSALGFPLWAAPEDGGGLSDFTPGATFGVDGRFFYPLGAESEQRYLLDPENPELTWIDHRFHPYRWGFYLVGDFGWGGASLGYTDGGAAATNRLSSLYILGGLRAFYQLEASWCPYGELLVGYTHASFSDEAGAAGERELDGGGLALSVGGGVEYLLTDHLALDGSLTFFRGDFINEYTNVDDEGVEVGGRVFGGARLTFGVGVNYYF